jgi:NAD(P)-dependent dehydrogenase (short-subunit alcohol dehydrogenase family)
MFKKVIDVKLLGTFYCAKAAAEQMVRQGEGGRIVNLSSTMGKSGRANTSAYNAANFAVDGFTQALSKELGEHAITVNSVCPGLIETARMDGLGRTDRWDARLAEIPLGRAGTDEEVGELIGFLCSHRAAYITGQSINVNGGVITER